jgi:hypothetical protein
LRKSLPLRGGIAYRPGGSTPEDSPSPVAVPNPASDSSPSGPVLRANPYPEVTDLACRLPLPTLFYQPEAVNLGDLLRIWVRPGTKIIRSLGFSWDDRSAPDTARAAVLYGNNIPISGQADSRESVPYKEKTTLPGTPADSLRVRLRYRHGPYPPSLRTGEAGPIPVSRFRNINRIPFRSRQAKASKAWTVGTGFPDPLGPTDPCSTAVHMEPFSTSVLKDLT